MKQCLYKTIIVLQLGLLIGFTSCKSDIEEMIPAMHLQGTNQDDSGDTDTRATSIVCEVKTTVAGQLMALMDSLAAVGEYAKEDVTELTIEGPVSEDDLRALIPFTKIEKLDLSDITIYNATGYHRTSWGSELMMGFASPAYVKMPTSINQVDWRGFYDSNITGIEFPENITYLSSSVLGSCNNLTRVKLPSKLDRIEYGVFEDCSSLEEIALPEGITSIEGCAFRLCPIKTIEIPDGVEYIGGSAFSGCKKLETFNWPKALTTVDWYAFDGCEALTSVSLPSTVTTWGEGVFRTCINLESVTGIENWTIIPNEFFSYCEKLKMELPHQLVEIGNDAFAFCNSLNAISLPSTLTTVGNHAFWHCEGITSVDLPATVTSWGEAVFYGCNKLATVKGVENWTEIPVQFFAHCDSLKNVSLDNVVTIKIEAFAYCRSLENLKFPASLKEIGDAAFYDCRSITEVHFPEGLEKIGASAFRYNNLTEVKFPASLKEIGDAAFHDCRSITEVHFPEGLEKIGVRAFGYNDLTEVTFPASLKEVGEGVLDRNYNMKVVYWHTNAEMPRLSENVTIPYIYAKAGIAYDKNNGTNMIFGDDTNGYVAEEFYLDADQDFYCPKSFTAKKAVMRRYSGGNSNGTNGAPQNWQFISLPFTVTKFKVKEYGDQPERDLLPFGSENMGDAKPFWLRTLAADGFVRATSLEAGKPYIICFPYSDAYLPEYNIQGTIEYWGENVRIMANDEELTSAAGPGFTIYPTFRRMDPADDIYTFGWRDVYDENGYWLYWGSVLGKFNHSVDRFTGYAKVDDASTRMIPVSGGNASTRTGKQPGPVPMEDDM